MLFLIMKKVILGATGSIGSSLAKKLVESGEEVHLVGRDENSLSELANNLYLDFNLTPPSIISLPSVKAWISNPIPTSFFFLLKITSLKSNRSSYVVILKFLLEPFISLKGFSLSISSDGTIVAIGAYYNDGNGACSGHVRCLL